jgi:transposase
MPKPLKFQLTTTELQSLADTIKHDKRPEVLQRAIGIRLLHEGKSPKIIAEMFSVSQPTVYNWHHRWRQKGADGLANRSKSGRPPKLSDDQILVLRNILAQGAITHGWHNELWTAKRVIDIIHRRFEVNISNSQVRKLLRKRLGWTSQRPSQIESKRDETKIADWKENIFPKIVTYTYSRNAYLVFIDEAGFMASPIRRQTYAPRGKPPIVKVTEPHRRISTAGAITVSPKKQNLNFIYHVLPVNQNYRGNTIVIFLKEILNRIRNPMTILWDGFSIHISEPVNIFLEEHPEIRIEPFPEYAHELNPVDKVWLYLKYDCLANYAPQTLAELRDRLLQELDVLPLKSNVLAWCIEQTGLKTHLS